MARGTRYQPEQVVNLLRQIEVAVANGKTTAQGRQLGRFDQHRLDVLVPLPGERHAHHLVGRTVLLTTQLAIADRFFDRGEPGKVADFQSPGQSRDRTYAGNRPQPLLQERIALRSADQRIVQLLTSLDLFAQIFSRGRMLSLISSLWESRSLK